MKKLFLILAFFSASAFAELKEDGNELLTALSSQSNFDRGYSRGYIIGLAHTISYSFCTPNGVTHSQIFDVVKIYLEKNPSTRHEHMHVLIPRALVNAFPCKQEPTTKPKKPI